MAKTRSKNLEIDDEDDDIETLEPAPVESARRTDDGMVLDLDGLGGAVASALVVNGLRAYLSVVNKGVNVVATDRAHTAFVPVKVEACGTGLDVRRDEARPLVDGRGVLAFLRDDGDGRTSYYLPVTEYLEMAADHGESGLRLDPAAHAEWLQKHKGHAGLRRAFARLLG